MMEMVVNGVSTRKIRRVTEKLCGTKFSKSTVPELRKRLDPIIHEWNERSLAEKVYPFVIVDALVLKIRKGGRVRSQSTLLAIGIHEDGYRKVLGLRIRNSESEGSWSEYLAGLKARGDFVVF
jgi:putative transposase